MPVNPRTIAIVGAGTAGASVGTLLARAGHRVVVFERVADPKPVGAGITLQPTGQATLVRLGLFDAIRARGAHVDRLHVRKRSGGVLMDLPYAAVDPELWGIGIHRGVLFETLFGALRASTAEIRCGVAIAKTELAADGRYLIGDDGARHGPYDLVVAADGGVCELHHAATRVRSTPYGWGALWIVAEDPGGTFTNARTCAQIVDRAHHMLGFLPTGLGPRGDKPMVSLFWSIRADRVEAWRAAGLAPWRDTILGFEPRAEPILDTLNGRLDGVLYSRYHDVAMWPWHGDRLVFLGDAAHATSPQLGQGANLALIDAVTFADCFAATDDVSAALAAYSAARRRHLNYYQFMTRALTPFFQSDSRVLALLRDLTFPVSRWLSPLRRRMVRTMCGIDRGILRRPIPIAEVKQRLLSIR